MKTLLSLPIAIVFSVYGGAGYFVCSASAEVIFHDDFGDADFEDGSPVTWVPLTQARYDASSGDLVVPRSHVIENGGIIGVPEIDLRDVSLRLQSQMDAITTPAVIEVLVRGDRLVGQAVTGRLIICPDDIRASMRQGGGVDWCDEDDWVEVDVDPRIDDVVLQLNAFGSNATFWVWNAGEPKPQEPTLTLDVTLGAGEVGVVYDEDSVNGAGIFRYVRLEDSPIEDLPGDFDFNFQLNATDIDLLSAEIRTPQPRSWFDLNNDQSVDDEDRQFWVESVVGTFFGDADLNGRVDFTDFVALSNNFGQQGGWMQGDFDGSRNVAFPDFVMLSSNFGNAREALASQSVPEPNTVIVALAGCLCVLAGRKQLERVPRNRPREGRCPS